MLKTLLITVVFLCACFTMHAQDDCGTVAEPFNIEDSTEVARQAPFKLDAAESLIYLQSKGYKLKESYLNMLEKEMPEIYARFKEKERNKGKREGNGKSSGLRTSADASGLDYVEVRFWRHLDYYTNVPYVSDTEFQNNIATAIDILNADFASNDIPLRFYASCSNYTFKTNQYNASTEEITKSAASSLIDGVPNYSKGLDVFYFDGRINDNGTYVNFAKYPWADRNYAVAATGTGLRTRTFTHEVGHTLGLRHTHDNARGSGSDNKEAGGCYQESVSRTRRNYWYNGCTSTDTYLKCEINGDQISDTHASFEALSNHLNSSGYDGTGGTDNWNDAWTPPVNNFMSYTWQQFRTEFSPMQISRLLNYADSRKTSSSVSITGPSRLCVGATGTYSVSTSGVTGYSWSVPPGLEILSGQGTNTVNIKNNSASSGGVIEVAFEGCGAFGASRKVEGSANYYYVIGNDNVYPGSSIETYSVSNSNEAGITYAWAAPANTRVIGSTTGSSVTLEFLSSFTGGSLSVKETTVCGSSSSSIYIQANTSGGPGGGTLEPQSTTAVDDTIPYAVYPNPSNGDITIECLLKDDYTIQLISLDNRIRKEVHVSSRKSKLDFSSYPTGMYILKIIASDMTVYTEKLIIK
jgi:hypothetical protein